MRVGPLAGMTDGSMYGVFGGGGSDVLDRDDVGGAVVMLWFKVAFVCWRFSRRSCLYRFARIMCLMIIF